MPKEPNIFFIYKKQWEYTCSWRHSPWQASIYRNRNH